MSARFSASYHPRVILWTICLIGGVIGLSSLGQGYTRVVLFVTANLAAAALIFPARGPWLERGAPLLATLAAASLFLTVEVTRGWWGGASQARHLVSATRVTRGLDAELAGAMLRVEPRRGRAWVLSKDRQLWRAELGGVWSRGPDLPADVSEPVDLAPGLDSVAIVDASFVIWRWRSGRWSREDLRPILYAEMCERVRGAGWPELECGASFWTRFADATREGRPSDRLMEMFWHKSVRLSICGFERLWDGSHRLRVENSSMTVHRCAHLGPTKRSYLFAPEGERWGLVRGGENQRVARAPRQPFGGGRSICESRAATPTWITRTRNREQEPRVIEREKGSSLIWMSDDVIIDPPTGRLVGFDEACDVAWRSRFDVISPERAAPMALDEFDGTFSKEGAMLLSIADGEIWSMRVPAEPARADAVAVLFASLGGGDLALVIATVLLQILAFVLWVKSGGGAWAVSADETPGI